MVLQGQQISVAGSVPDNLAVPVLDLDGRLLAALALAANCSGEHPFAAKFRLYQSGHWPLGLYDGIFHIL